MRKRINERISGWFNDWLGTIVSVLALMALVRHGFNYGFSPTLQLMLDAYEGTTRFFLEWTEPYIKELIAALRKFIDWDLMLYSHWKHIFLLMMLYFGARLKAAWVVGEYAAATYLLIVGFSLAISASIAAGTVPLQPSTNQQAISLLVAIFPVAGVLIFDTMEIIWSSTFRREQLVETFGDPALTRRAIFVKLARKVLARFVFAAAVIFGWTQAWRLPVLHELPSPGLIVLGFLIVATAIYWLYQGFEATRTVRRSAERDVTDPQPSEKFVDAWWRRGSTRVGWLILRSVGVLLVVVAISAGEKLLGR